MVGVYFSGSGARERQGRRSLPHYNSAVKERLNSHTNVEEVKCGTQISLLERDLCFM